MAFFLTDGKPKISNFDPAMSNKEIGEFEISMYISKLIQFLIP
jgi:hypothetical protein